MPETIDDRTIVNNALARIGASPLGALDEETPKARQVRAVYADTIETLLGLYDWSFNRRTYALDAIAQTVEKRLCRRRPQIQEWLEIRLRPAGHTARRAVAGAARSATAGRSAAAIRYRRSNLYCG